MPTYTFNRRATSPSVALLVLVACLGATSAFAQGPHRARLSRDVADRLALRNNASSDIIVSSSDATVDQLVLRYGVRLKKRLAGGGAVLEATGGQIDAISQDPDVDHVSGNPTVFRMMAVTTEATGADQVWSGLAGLPGIDGRGVTVAVIDSGVSNHPALRDRVIVAKDFTGAPGGARDDYGHGTHVAGIIGESGRDGYGGMAPGAWIANLRVLGPDGSGSTDNVIDAIDWAIRNRQRYNIRVINLSLGHPVFESYLDDPLCQAAARAVNAGIVVVAAAGNFGKTDDGRPVVGGIIAPGNTPSVLTVGALNTKGTPARSDDVMATYSSRGPTLVDGVLKPELVAPGNRIVAASAAGSYLATTYPDRVVVNGPGAADYIELSGTSMSSAVVSGAAALVLSARPDLSPAQVKAALQLTASRVPGAGLIVAGAGSLNVAGAVELVETPPRDDRIPITDIAGDGGGGESERGGGGGAGGNSASRRPHPDYRYRWRANSSQRSNLYRSAENPPHIAGARLGQQRLHQFNEQRSEHLASLKSRQRQHPGLGQRED
jgi:serine protease AprX